MRALMDKPVILANMAGRTCTIAISVGILQGLCQRLSEGRWVTQPGPINLGVWINLGVCAA